MGLVEIVLPKMGESVMEATVLSWLKKPGDKVELEEGLLEVATDKVDTEVPSSHGGILQELLVEKGDVVQVGSPVALILTDEEETAIIPESETADFAKVRESKHVTNGSNQKTTPGHDFQRSPEKRFYSPLVRNIAQEEDIALGELEKVPGTGKEGRVTKKDILAYLEKRKFGLETGARQNGISLTVQDGDEIIEMDRMRKMIAERMIESKNISAHVTSFVEADVTDVVEWRSKIKKDFFEKTNEPITFTPLFVEAIAKAIVDFPMINIQVDRDRIIKKKNINIGVAVALGSGNLIVPVVHKANTLSFLELVKLTNDLVRRAKDNELKPDELAGGTFTLSNIGTFDNLLGTPIIMQPQVGIIAFGSIQKKPAVVESPDGDSIQIRHKIYLSHSYDHRVVDGALGGMMVKRVAHYLENFDVTRTV